MSHALSLAALLATCALLPVSSIAQLSFESHQVAQVAAGSNIAAHGDFNNDGREDLVAITYDTTSQRLGRRFSSFCTLLGLSGGWRIVSRPIASSCRDDQIGAGSKGQFDGMDTGCWRPRLEAEHI